MIKNRPNNYKSSKDFFKKGNKARFKKLSSIRDFKINSRSVSPHINEKQRRKAGAGGGKKSTSGMRGQRRSQREERYYKKSSGNRIVGYDSENQVGGRKSRMRSSDKNYNSGINFAISALS